MKKVIFANDEYYHIYNRGTDKRDIFTDDYDWKRFFQCMEEFNSVEPIGSIFENNYNKKETLGRPTSKLVEFVAYCLNPNHFHFILKQKVENGVSEFMKRLGGGYTKYFNNKYKRSGVLFQGGFKSRYIDTNEYLLHLSAYVNLNDRVHMLGHTTSKSRDFSSWGEYVDGGAGSCDRSIVLEQFKNKREYEKFAENALGSILEQKEESKELEGYLLE